jgi:hypothetical protein
MHEELAYCLLLSPEHNTSGYISYNNASDRTEY